MANTMRSAQSAPSSITICDQVVFDATAYNAAFKALTSSDITILDFPLELLFLVLAPFLQHNPRTIRFDYQNNFQCESAGIYDPRLLQVCSRFSQAGEKLLYHDHIFEFTSMYMTDYFLRLDILRRLRVHPPSTEGEVKAWQKALGTAVSLQRLHIPINKFKKVYSGDEGEVAGMLASACRYLLCERIRQIFLEDKARSLLEILQALFSIFCFEGKGRLYLSEDSERRVVKGDQYRDGGPWEQEDYDMFEVKFVNSVLRKLAPKHSGLTKKVYGAMWKIRARVVLSFNVELDNELPASVHGSGLNNPGVIVQPNVFSSRKPQKAQPSPRLKIKPALTPSCHLPHPDHGFPATVQPTAEMRHVSPVVTIAACIKSLKNSLALNKGSGSKAPTLFKAVHPMHLQQAHFWLSFRHPKPIRTMFYVQKAFDNVPGEFLQISYTATDHQRRQVFTFDVPQANQCYIPGLGAPCQQFPSVPFCGHPSCYFEHLILQLARTGVAHDIERQLMWTRE